MLGLVNLSPFTLKTGMTDVKAVTDILYTNGTASNSPENIVKKKRASSAAADGSNEEIISSLLLQEMLRAAAVVDTENSIDGVVGESRERRQTAASVKDNTEAVRGFLSKYMAGQDVKLRLRGPDTTNWANATYVQRSLANVWGQSFCSASLSGPLSLNASVTSRVVFS